jgi:hypothetical protein
MGRGGTWELALRMFGSAASRNGAALFSFLPCLVDSSSNSIAPASEYSPNMWNLEVQQNRSKQTTRAGSSTRIQIEIEQNDSIPDFGDGMNLFCVFDRNHSIFYLVQECKRNGAAASMFG